MGNDEDIKTAEVDLENDAVIENDHAEKKEYDIISNDIPEIEIPDYFEAFTKDKDEIPAGEAYLTTSEVVQRLNASHRNVVIRYTSTFFDILAVKQNKMNSRYMYTEEAVKQLAFIMNDVRESGRTMKQELEYLQSKTGGKVMNLAANNTQVMEQLFNSLQRNIIESNKQLLLSSNKQMLEDKKEMTDAITNLERRLEEQQFNLKQMLDMKDEQIETLKKQLEESKLKEKKKGFLFFK